ncbi:hypothetical protein D9M68_223570 [compost metagenome]
MSDEARVRRRPQRIVMRAHLPMTKERGSFRADTTEREVIERTKSGPMTASAARTGSR